MIMSGEHQVTTVDLLRHGECEGGHVYRGSLDLPLSETGWQQLRSKAGDFREWTRIVSSPLQRCARFAEALSERHTLPLAIDDAFREVHFGDWEGRAIADVWREQGSHVRRFFADPVNAAPPNGEPLHEFEQRVVAGWNTLLRDNRGEHILLVAHGGTIRVLLAQVLAMPLTRIANLDVPYASASRIRIHHSEGQPDFISLVFHNSEFI
jgi:alpha-ribazole phosphatase